MPGPNRARSTTLQRVYRENADAVFAFFAYSVSREMAEDLTSATFERVLRSWADYDSRRAGERTWILAIARNLLTDHFRRQAVRRARLVSLEETQESVMRQAPISDRDLDRVLEADELRHWLSLLSKRDRDVLALRFGADLRAADVGSVLGISEANVHQITSRALRRLRDAVDP